jgi:hypothetical protein
VSAIKNYVGAQASLHEAFADHPYQTTRVQSASLSSTNVAQAAKVRFISILIKDMY